MDDLLETFDIVRIIDQEHSSQKDLVVIETPLTIFVNSQELVTLLCSPINHKNLAVGFLFSEGMLSSREEIKSVILNKNKGIVYIKLTKDINVSENFRKGRTITSGCARGLTFYKIFDEWQGEYITSKVKVKSNIVLNISAELKQKSLIFQKSGGTHSAALYLQNKFLFSREDIGRHNAVDKIIGECLVKGVSGEDKILMISGRISSEMLLKVARWQIPILISRSAPTSAAVRLADEIGVTLIGFARGKRMNVYTNNWRIE